MIAGEELPGKTMSPLCSDFGASIQIPGGTGFSRLGSTCDGWKIVFGLA